MAIPLVNQSERHCEILNPWICSYVGDAHGPVQTSCRTLLSPATIRYISAMAQQLRNDGRTQRRAAARQPQQDRQPDLFGPMLAPLAAPRPVLIPAPDITAQRADMWIDRLAAAFDDSRKYAKSLALAEEALAAYPGDINLLIMAATAALFEGEVERALVFLKRFDKRAVAPASKLLRAIALQRSGLTAAAKRLLEQERLTDWFVQLRAFPGGWKRARWLQDEMDAILEPAEMRRRPALVPPARKHTARAAGKQPPPATIKRKSGGSKPAAVAAVAPIPTDAQPEPAALVPIDIPFPFALTFDSAPLLSALPGICASSSSTADSDGLWFGLRQRLVHLSLAQGFDELLCENHLSGVEPLSHQIETVRKVLRQFHGRVLLADEVGLGKTIEACMVLKEYALRGMAERALILTPASLVGQWREELETKFALPFATTYDALLREDPAMFWAQKHIVASIATARRREHADVLSASSFDIVIVDEAHHLKNRTSQSWKLVDALNKRFLLLLSATPVQNDLVELYNLLTLLRPGIFKTPKDFRAAHMTPGKPRVPANPDALRVLMRDAMIRNTRAVVALKLPRRHASTLKVEGAEGEAAAYAALTEAARDLAAIDGVGRQRFALHHLLSAAGSSARAAAAALARMAEREPKTKVWAKLARQWAALGRSGKETALLELLQKNPVEKKIVFVQARETLEHLCTTLEEAGISFARFDGSLSGPDKDTAIAAFRDDASVLLCTQSGGEGRNIQFCNTLINFDVPWNPMAIEQRIGRIDRIGQEREVFVFNLVTRGTLEEQVLVLLDEKIAMFEMVVGEVGAILGGLEEDREFPDLVLDAWLAQTDGDRAVAFETLAQSLTAARQQHDGAKALDETLFGEDFDAG